MMRPFGAGPDVPDARANDTWGTLKRLGAYLAPYWRRLIVILLLTLVSAAMQAVGPYLIGVAIDQHISKGDGAGLATIMLLLLGSFVVGWAVRVVQGYHMGWVAQSTLTGIRGSIFQAIQRQSLRFFDKREAGDLMSRLVNDVEAINVILGQGLVQTVGALFGLVGIVIAMILLNVPLALASFIVLPIMFLTTSVFSRMARRAFRKTRETIGHVSANLQEDIAGIKVAQAYNRTGFNRQRFAERNRANRNANVGANAITSAFFPAMDVLGAVSVAIVAGYGGYLAIQGQVTVGVVVAFLGYVQQFFWPIQQAAQLYTQSQSALAAGERIFELVDAPIELVDRPSAGTFGRAEGQVEFRGVTFGYEPKDKVLDDVSFTVPAGQTVALVGPTGAGKTTIVNLIARFYDVNQGEVLIDGRDVRDVTMASLRTQMGMVPQNSFLFAGTIADNIRYGRLDATDEEVESAARTVNAHDFIARLPDGYRSHLGERGGTLSQGQRQLIAFARAILADPRILILDEATASVDSRTEVLIQSALKNLLASRTSFVIAHRLSTIRNADQVLVVDDGRIVERGRHRELLERGGLYAELYRRQFRDIVPAGVPVGEGIAP